MPTDQYGFVWDDDNETRDCTAFLPETTHDSPDPNLSRRDLLKGAGALTAAALLPGAATVQGQEQLVSLTAKESEILRAIVARIIPADENGPGALEARADRFIDRALSGALQSTRSAYAAGLAAVDA